MVYRSSTHSSSLNYANELATTDTESPTRGARQIEPKLGENQLASSALRQDLKGIGGWRGRE